MEKNLDITKPRYSEQSLLNPGPFVMEWHHFIEVLFQIYYYYFGEKNSSL